MRFMGLVIPFFGCGGKSDDSSGTESDADVDSDTDSDTDADSDADTDTDITFPYQGNYDGLWQFEATNNDTMSLYVGDCTGALDVTVDGSGNVTSNCGDGVCKGNIADKAAVGPNPACDAVGTVAKDGSGTLDFTLDGIKHDCTLHVDWNFNDIHGVLFVGGITIQSTYNDCGDYTVAFSTSGELVK